jgi:hypothetical protein
MSDAEYGFDSLKLHIRMGTLNNGLTGRVCCRVRRDRPDSESSNAVVPCLDCVRAHLETTLGKEDLIVWACSQGESLLQVEEETGRGLRCERESA